MRQDKESKVGPEGIHDKSPGGGLVREIPASRVFSKRSGDPETHTKTSLASSLEQSRELIESARYEASQTLRAAKDQATMIKEKAYEDGFSAGLKEALSKIISAKTIKEKTLLEAETTAVSIALAVSEKIIGEALTAGDYRLEDRVKAALSEKTFTQEVTIKINPADEALLGANLSHFNELELSGGFQLITDDRVPIGDAKILTEYGAIEISLSKHFEAIRDILVPSGS